MKYEYATLHFVCVVNFATPTEHIPKDSYLSDDPDSRAYIRLLSEGYRWIRTDGDWAIFEREVQT